jgi:hypothetical protein
MNQMWILKNSKDMLEYIQSRSLSSCNSIKTFDLSTLDITNMLSIKNVDDISFRERFGRIRVVFAFYKIRPASS